ncbi:MAG: LapA family protein [Steroidobacteraceae bacterium]
MSRLRFYAGALLGTLVSVFALQNLQDVQVRLFLWYLELPLVVVVASATVIGALWASLWLAVRRRRRAKLDFDV